MLTLSWGEKLKKLILEIPIIPQTLNINSQRTKIAKFINLKIVRKLIKYSFKKVPVKTRLILIVLEILLFESRLTVRLAQRGPGSKRIKLNNNCSLFSSQVGLKANTGQQLIILSKTIRDSNCNGKKSELVMLTCNKKLYRGLFSTKFYFSTHGSRIFTYVSLLNFLSTEVNSLST